MSTNLQKYLFCCFTAIPTLLLVWSRYPKNRLTWT